MPPAPRCPLAAGGAGGGEFWEPRGGGGRDSDSEVLWGSVVLLSWFCCDLAPRGFCAVWEGRCRQVGRPAGTLWGRCFGLDPFLHADPTGGDRQWHLAVHPASPQGTEHPRALSPTGKSTSRGFLCRAPFSKSTSTAAQKERQTQTSCCCCTPHSPPSRSLAEKQTQRSVSRCVCFYFLQIVFSVYFLSPCES